MRLSNMLCGLRYGGEDECFGMLVRVFAGCCIVFAHF